MPYLLKPYDDALQEILDRGIRKADRTGVGCVSVAGLQRRYDLTTVAFPFVTRRKLFPKSVWAELIWFLSGSTMNQDLEALGAKFWGKWCDENNPKYRALREKYGYAPGDFGPIYGWQLRHFGADYVEYRNTRYARAVDPGGFDQLAFMIDTLKNDPYGSNGRRCLFSLWNPPDLEKMALPPCHYTYQAIADGDGGLTGILTQRSCDFPVGVPYNIAFYSALTIMLAQQSGFTPREFIHNTNDSHIYVNQIEQVKEYLSRPAPDSPRLTIRKADDIYSYKVEDFMMEDYNPGPLIDVPVAV